jgi:hypothetical protein
MEGDAHTLSLLRDLRRLCQRISEHHEDYATALHKLLQQVHNPNLHELDTELSFRVVELEPGYYGPSLRVVSASCNLRLGRAALEAAVKSDPTKSWLLKYPRRRSRPLRSSGCGAERDMKESLYLKAGAPTRCHNRACNKKFESSCIRGKDDRYYCSEACAQVELTIDVAAQHKFCIAN